MSLDCSHCKLPINQGDKAIMMEGEGGIFHQHCKQDHVARPESTVDISRVSASLVDGNVIISELNVFDGSLSDFQTLVSSVVEKYGVDARIDLVSDCGYLEVCVATAEQCRTHVKHRAEVDKQRAFNNTKDRQLDAEKFKALFDANYAKYKGIE